jgi:hypothetical protein
MVYVRSDVVAVLCNVMSAYDLSVQMSWQFEARLCRIFFVFKEEEVFEARLCRIFFVFEEEEVFEARLCRIRQVRQISLCENSYLTS